MEGGDMVNLPKFTRFDKAELSTVFQIKFDLETSEPAMDGSNRGLLIVDDVERSVNLAFSERPIRSISAYC
jgi:hypothetical protein